MEAYIVHKEGETGTLLLSANGRIITEPFDIPDWVPEGAAVARLAERQKFYEARLGPNAGSLPPLSSNIINILDLGWVAVDEEGEVTELQADDEFRQNMLRAVIGVDAEGTVSGSVTEHYVESQTPAYTAEEVVSKADSDKLHATGN